MSTTIDEKVIEMQFDNKDFEKNVKTSMDSINKLKKDLDFDDTAKSLSGFQRIMSKFNLKGMSSAVDEVSHRFSALEVMGMTAIANLTNSAVNHAKQMLSSLTIEPIKQGYDEYELKMGSVQTIMASTGQDIQTVNKYLEELNTYADKTIYSFSDMTASIGKFTNSGVSLDNAVKAIQGVSNVAAVSGANSAEASRAMYNFAQALSSGAVKLIDWKSIENANMSTVEFKQSLIDTAVALGKVKKEGDKYVSTTTDANGKTSEAFTATSMFNDSLSSQWMTTEVLVQTLSNYSTDIREMSEEEKKAYEEKLRGVGYTEEQIKAIEELGQKAFDAAQDVKTFTQLMDTLKEAVGSGWSQTFEILFGNLEEAKKLWTAVSNEIGGIIGASADSRNALLSDWKKLRGREQIFDGIANAWKNIRNVIETVRSAFQEVFPPMTAARLMQISVAFKKLTERLMLSDKDLENVKSAFRDLFTVLKSVKDILAPIISAFKGVFDEVIPKDLFSRIAGVAKAIRDFVSSIKIPSNLGERFSNIFKGIFGFFDIIRQFVFAAAGPAIKIILRIVNAIISVASVLGKWVYAIDQYLKTNDTFNRVIKGTIDLFKAIAQVIVKAYNAVDKFIKKLSGKSIEEIFVSIGETIKDSFKAIGEIFSGENITNVFTTVADKIRSAFGIAKDSVEGFGDIKTEGIESFGDKIRRVLGPLGFIFDAIKLVAGAVGGFIKSIGPTILKILGDVRSVFERVSSRFVELLATADSSDIWNYVKSGALIALTSKLSGFLKNLTKNTKEAAESAGGIRGVLDNIGSLVENVTGILNGVKDTLTSWQQSIKANIILKIAIAIGILTVSLINLADIDQHKLHGALEVMTMGFVELMGALKILTAGKTTFAGLWNVAGMLLGMSLSILIMVSALKKLTELDMDKLQLGMGALTLMLAELTAVTKILSGSDKIASGFITLSLAILILVKAVKKLSDIDSDKLLSGVMGLAGILLSLTVAMNFMPNTKRMISFGLGMTLFANAMNSFAKVIVTFAALDPARLETALISFVSVLSTIVTSIVALQRNSKGLTKVTMTLNSVATAMLIMSAAFKIFASNDVDQTIAGVTAFSAVMATVVAAFRIMQENTKALLRIGATMNIVAIAMIGMAAAFKIFASNDIQSVENGLIAFGGIMAIIVTSLKLLLDETDGLGKITLSLMGLSLTMIFMASAIADMGELGFPKIWAGIIGFAGAMAVLVGAIKVLGNDVQDIENIAIAMWVLSDALEDISEAVIAYSNVETAKLFKGLLAFAAVLSVVVGAIQVMQFNTDGMLKIAIAFQVLAPALLVLALAMKIFGTMGVVSIIASMVMLASTFSMIAIAAKLLAPTIKYIFQLAKSLIALAVGVVGIGAGMLMLASGLATLAASGAAAVMALVSLVKGIISLLPYFAEEFVKMLKVALAALTDVLPDLRVFLSALLKEVLKFIAESLSSIVEALFEIIFGLFDALRRNAPRLISELLEIIFMLIDSLARNAIKITDKLVNLILDLIDGIGKALAKNAKKISQVLADLIVNVLAAALGIVFPWLVDWLTGSTDKLVKKVEVLTEEEKKILNKAREMKRAYDDLNAARSDGFKSIDYEYDYIKDLKDEYNSLVDANGNIKSGYEKRAETIKTTLADALGIEKKQIEEMIDANGKLSSSFDQVMIKMEAEAYMSANKGAYEEALRSRQEAYKTYIESGNVFSDLEQRYKIAEVEYEKANQLYEDMKKQGAGGWDAAAQFKEETLDRLKTMKVSLGEEMNIARRTYKDAEEMYVGYSQVITNQQNLLSAVENGTIEEMREAMDKMQNNYIEAQAGTKRTLELQIKDQEDYVKEMREALQRGSELVTQDELDEAEKRLGLMRGELVKHELMYGQSGEQRMVNLGEGIEKKSDVAETAANNAEDKVTDGMDDLPVKMGDIGNMSVMGLSNSLTSTDNLNKLYNDGELMAQTVQDGYKDADDQHSPSRKMFSIGMFTIKGLINGLLNLKGKVHDTGAEVAEEASDGMSTALNDMMTIFGSDMDYEPTIHPIVDLTGVSAGANAINGLLNMDKTMELSRKAMFEANVAWARNQNGLQVNNSDIVASLESLKKNMSSLEDKVGNLKVVMDTGALVGQIAQPIDRAFGKQAMYKGRGI